MHESLYEGLNFDSVQEYIEWLQSRPRELYNWFEKHADWFAGQILVPTDRLVEQCVNFLDSNSETFSEYEYLSPEFWSYASNDLAEPFEVNPVVVEIRIRYEGLSEKYKDYYKN